MERRTYWSLSGVVQSTGFLLLVFTNIHANIAPLFVGTVLLLPGGALIMWSVFGNRLPLSVLVIVVLAVNAGAWAAFQKWRGKEWK